MALLNYIKGIALIVSLLVCVAGTFIAAAYAIGGHFLIALALGIPCMVAGKFVADKVL